MFRPLGGGGQYLVGCSVAAVTALGPFGIVSISLAHLPPVPNPDTTSGLRLVLDPPARPPRFSLHSGTVAVLARGHRLAVKTGRTFRLSPEHDAATPFVVEMACLW